MVTIEGITLRKEVLDLDLYVAIVATVVQHYIRHSSYTTGMSYMDMLHKGLSVVENRIQQCFWGNIVPGCQQYMFSTNHPAIKCTIAKQYC